VAGVLVVPGVPVVPAVGVVSSLRRGRGVPAVRVIVVLVSDVVFHLDTHYKSLGRP
jgi:hypothetical protein